MTGPTRTVTPVAQQPYRVIVTGSPTWTDQPAVHCALGRSWTDATAVSRHLVVVHCRASGAGRIAAQWVKGMTAAGVPGVSAAAHSAPNGAHTDGPCGTAAPRHGEAAECLVFAEQCRRYDCQQETSHPEHGPSNCGDLAEAAGIVTRHWAN